MKDVQPKTNSHICHVCNGEGAVLEAVPGGYFDPLAECWYPDERLISCQPCRGSGRLTGPQHPNTFNATPAYAQLKAKRKRKRKSTNEVVAMILGITPQELRAKDYTRR